MKKKFQVEVRESVIRVASVEVELDIDGDEDSEDVECWAGEEAQSAANEQDLWRTTRVLHEDYSVTEIK